MGVCWKGTPSWCAQIDILTEVDGNHYHKNTSNALARIGNFLGGNFVEHKPYNPTTEEGLNESIVTGTGYAAGGLALRGFSVITSKGGSSFFHGTKYTNKVLRQMKSEPFHAFPESVKAFESSGVISRIKGGDGITRQMLKIPGWKKGFL